MRTESTLRGKSAQRYGVSGHPGLLGAAVFGAAVFGAAVLGAAVLGAAVFGACKGPLVPHGEGRARLRLDVSSGAAWKRAEAPQNAHNERARSLLPPVSPVPASFRLVAQEQSGESLSCVLSGPGASIEFKPGDWRLVVEALDASGGILERGEAAIRLEAGDDKTLCLALTPLAGTGSFSVNLQYAYPPPEGSVLVGRLMRESGPPTEAPREMGIRLDPGAGSLAFTELAAGRYILELRLEKEGNVLSGLAEDVLILAGYATAGSVLLNIAEPTLSLSLRLLPLAALTGLRLPAPCLVNREAALRLPLLGLEAGAEATFYLNGMPLQGAIPEEVAVIPQGGLRGPLRLDARVHDPETGAAGSVGLWFTRLDGPCGLSSAWLASYDAAALSPRSVALGLGDPIPGAAVKAVTRVSLSGGKRLLAVSGLDAETKLHLFSEREGALFAGFSTEIRVAGTPRSADRLAASPNGRLLAASGSASSYLRLIELGEEGIPTRNHDRKQGDAGLANFSQIRGLAFSPSGERLFALANSPAKLYAFASAPGADLDAAPVARFDLDLAFPGQALGLADIAAGTESLIASASGINRLLEFGSREGELSLLRTYDQAVLGAELTKPGSLALSADGLRLYVLCNGSSILLLRRASQAEAFVAAAGYPLPDVASGASILELDECESRLAVLGAPGGALALYTLDPASGSPSLAELITAPGSPVFSFEGAAGAAFSGDWLVVAGGNSKRIAIFGPRGSP